VFQESETVLPASAVYVHGPSVRLAAVTRNWPPAAAPALTVRVYLPVVVLAEPST
jgi:hypothetical protein